MPQIKWLSSTVAVTFVSSVALSGREYFPWTAQLSSLLVRGGPGGGERSIVSRSTKLPAIDNRPRLSHAPANRRSSSPTRLLNWNSPSCHPVKLAPPCHGDVAVP